MRSRLRTALPTLLVLGALIGIAAWGHATDWTLPKFSALMSGGGSGTVCAEGADGWCKEHNVPETICIECNSKLLPALTDYGWCPKHGIAQCPLEHPDVAQLAEIPSIAPDEIDRADRALALLPRAENSSRCKNYQHRIQFASAEAIEKAGVDIAVVQQSPVVESISANGEIIYDQTHLAHLSNRAAGTVWRVEKKVGDQVRQGDILALVDSADVGKAKSDLLAAIAEFRLKQANVERLQPLASGGAVAGKQIIEAEAALETAKINLLSAGQTLINLGLPADLAEYQPLSIEQIAKRIQFLGLSADLAARLDKGPATSNLAPIRAPLDGVVIDCTVVPGVVLAANTMIFGVADVDRMWLMLDVRGEDAGHLSLGQPVLFQASEIKGVPQIQGNIDWISTETDDKTRTVKVRAQVANADRRLRSNTFGTGRIVLREEPKACIVPTEAIHTDGDCAIVFVRDKNYFQEGAYKFFHVREVRTGVRDGSNTEIIAGLLPGEVVASKNSMVLEAQLLKSNLGEGCACCAAVKKSEK